MPKAESLIGWCGSARLPPKPDAQMVPQDLRSRLHIDLTLNLDVSVVNAALLSSLLIEKNLLLYSYSLLFFILEKEKKKF